MARNTDLQAANRAKKDEFYTQLPEIEKELKYYRKHFRDQIIYCNCDDPTVSNFYRYFFLNFAKLGIKKLITTCYKNQQPDLFSQHVCEAAVGVEYVGNGTQSNVFQLEGDGDFRSRECIDLLNQADIVVTNPPFSLFREYIAELMEHDKKFLVIGNMNATTYKEIFPLIKDNKLWYGASIKSGDREFGVPPYYPLTAASSRVDENGNRFVRVKGVRWFTNLEHKKRKEELILYKNYSPDEYPKYDNYYAVEVPKTAHIPVDYAEPMGVPISFLDKHSPDQFEIIGMDNFLLPQLNDNRGRFYLKGERLYSRIVIRNKRIRK